MKKNESKRTSKKCEPRGRIIGHYISSQDSLKANITLDLTIKICGYENALKTFRDIEAFLNGEKNIK